MGLKKSHIVCLWGIAEPMKYLTKTSEVIDLTINPSINIINECSKQKRKFILHQPLKYMEI